MRAPLFSSVQTFGVLAVAEEVDENAPRNLLKVSITCRDTK